MKITIQSTVDVKRDVVVLGLFEEDSEHYAVFSKNLSLELEDAIIKKVFSKKFGELYSTRVDGKRTVVLGLGKKNEFNLEKLRRILGKSVKCAKAAKQESFATNILELVKHHTALKDEDIGRAAAEALLLANYSFTKYLSAERLEKEKNVTHASLQWTKNQTTLGKGFSTGRVIAEATNFVKDLVNEPAAVATPLYLEQVARKVASSHKHISIRVMEKEEMKKEGLNVLLGVSRGSDYPPKLMFLEYKGSAGKLKAFVGKGITFDSGGYNLKPTHYIEDMKSDMAGAAAVMAVIKAAAELGLQQHLLAVLPVCENMIDARAQKPGDIVRAYNGKTIEITNTDAEGRLILADALSYTEAKYKPEIMIDLATLTGACVVALGFYASGIMGKDDKLIDELKSAGMESADRVWPLPFFEEYQDCMDGKISDLQNTSSKGKGYDAGAISGGVFLGKFVETARWAHIDIAGPAYLADDGDYTQKGGSGAGVRVLLYYLLQQEQ